MSTATLLRRSRGADHGVERVPWSELEPEIIREWGWPRGEYDPEHFTVYGPSGSGKTALIRRLLKERARVRGSHIVVVGTKRADRTMAAFGWPIRDSWPPDYGQNQVVYWCKPAGISAQHRIPQRVKVKALMDKLSVPDSNVVIYWDELTYIEQMLKLKAELEWYYREGRSHGITNMAGAQRPAHVTRAAHSEPAWNAAFRPKDEDDRRRVAEVFGDRARFMAVLGDLRKDEHEFVIHHDRTGDAYISRLPAGLGRTRPVAVRSRSK